MDSNSCWQQPYVRLIVGSVCISFSPIFIRTADINPDLAGFYRMLFALLSLFPILIFSHTDSRLRSCGRRSALLLLACGLIISVNFMCWHRSIQMIGPGLSTLLGNFQVFFTALASWILFRERIPPAFVLAVLMALSGLVLLTGVDLNSLSVETRAGILLGLATAGLYSSYLMCMQRAMVASTLSGSHAVFLISLVSTLTLGSLLLIRGDSFALVGWRPLLALLGAGVLSTTFAWSLISTAIRAVPATIAGLVLLLQPALSFVWDLLFFQRPTGILDFCGLSLILVAIFLGTQRPGG